MAGRRRASSGRRMPRPYPVRPTSSERGITNLLYYSEKVRLDGPIEPFCSIFGRFLQLFFRAHALDITELLRGSTGHRLRQVSPTNATQRFFAPDPSSPRMRPCL